MLQVTESAVDLLKQVRDQADLPETAHVRIQFTDSGSNGHGHVAIGFTDTPREADQVITESDELKIFLAQELTGELEGAVLDTVSTDRGVELELRGYEHEHGDHDGHDH